MQVNTMIKLGSLAFNVAQDDKVKELFTMLHHGAKRRGMFAPDQTMGQFGPHGDFSHPYGHPNAMAKTMVAQPIPFAPKPVPVQQGNVAQGFNVNKYLTMDNAKKVLGWAGTVSNLLSK